MIKRKQNKKGFTLIELLVVVIIIGILAAIAWPQYQLAVLKSQASAALPMLRAIAEAENMYYLTTDKYTYKFEELDITVLKDCAGNTCQHGKNQFFLGGAGDAVAHINGEQASHPNNLSLAVAFDPSSIMIKTYNMKKGILYCYDKGKEKFKKVCLSLGGHDSFDYLNGQAWIL
jgi:prepilin-type N-terminal cleavage/methylation domain-containing protein